jgi:hypothetical protein
MNDSQLPSHRQHRTLARRVRKLGSGSTNQGDDTSCVDNTATGLLVTTQTEDGVLLPNQTPLTLMLCVRSQIFSGVSIASASLACMIPALLKITSVPPQLSCDSTIACTSDSLDTSHRMDSTRGAEGTTSLTLANAFARAGSDTSAIRTLAPSRAKRILVSRPIPLSKSEIG